MNRKALFACVEQKYNITRTCHGITCGHCGRDYEVGSLVNFVSANHKRVAECCFEKLADEIKKQKPRKKSPKPLAKERFELDYEQPYVTDTDDSTDSEHEIAWATKTARSLLCGDKSVTDDEVQKQVREFLLNGKVNLRGHDYFRKGLALRRIIDIPLPT